MSQTVTIACPLTWRLESFAKNLEIIACAQETQLSKFDQQLQVVAKDASWKFIITEGTDPAGTATEYASNDDFDERFRREVGLLRFFTIWFDDVDVTRVFLRSTAQDALTRRETIWIDTDYGWVIDASEFLKRVEQDCRWDWRKAADDV